MSRDAATAKETALLLTLLIILTSEMQRPRIAAVLQALALMLAIIGISVCAKTATSVTVTALGLSFKQSTYGNTQLTLGFPPNLPQPLPNPVYKFKGACPEEPKCPNLSDPNDPSICLPSQSWSMVIVNQLFASFAIILQAATPIGLFLGKGSRKLYQGLSVCALIFLAVCAATLVQVPLRFIGECASFVNVGVAVGYEGGG